MFNGKYSKSLGPKTLIVIIFSSVITVIGMFMFCGSEQLVPLTMTGNKLRQIILFIGLVIYSLRMLVTLFVFLKRRMSWGEGLLGNDMGSDLNILHNRQGLGLVARCSIHKTILISSNQH